MLPSTPRFMRSPVGQVERIPNINEPEEPGLLELETATHFLILAERIYSLILSQSIFLYFCLR